MVRNLELTIINDNEPREGLKNDWGWSILAESEKWRILFDADTNSRIIEYNTKKMNIDLKKVNFGVLSHYHSDHYGGFEYVGKVAKGLKLYVPPGEYGFLKTWGLEPLEVRDGKKIAEDVWLSGPLGYFIREQAMGIKVDNVGLVVIVGCSHPGADALALRLKEITGEEIYLVIGGYHSPSKKVLDNLAKISKFISPAHCSGAEAKNYVRRKYPDKYLEVKTGSRIKIPNS
jgi:7,8-dihydropterin-6-yl-methyl-4-(beta-D-ribofuranosyl)aminobenzene 5'-phosphate synthase